MEEGSQQKEGGSQQKERKSFAQVNGNPCYGLITPSTSPNFQIIPDTLEMESAMIHNYPLVVPYPVDAFSSSTVIADSINFHTRLMQKHHHHCSKFSSSRSPSPSPLPLSIIDNLETPPPRSPPVFTTPMKIEEDVLVMDGIFVGSSVRGGRSRSSSDSGSSSPGYCLYKTEICRAWEETGNCSYGIKCQFAHGKEELRPGHYLTNKNSKSDVQVLKSSGIRGKNRFPRRVTASPSSAATAASASPPVSGGHVTAASSLAASESAWPPLPSHVMASSASASSAASASSVSAPPPTPGHDVTASSSVAASPPPSGHVVTASSASASPPHVTVSSSVESVSAPPPSPGHVTGSSSVESVPAPPPSPGHVTGSSSVESVPAPPPSPGHVTGSMVASTSASASAPPEMKQSKEEEERSAAEEWLPADNGIQIRIPSSSKEEPAASRETVNSHIRSVLYGPSRGRPRLPAFIEAENSSRDAEESEETRLASENVHRYLRAQIKMLPACNLKGPNEKGGPKK